MFAMRPESDLELSLKRQLAELQEQYELARGPLLEALAREQERQFPTSRIIGNEVGSNETFWFEKIHHPFSR